MKLISFEQENVIYTLRISFEDMDKIEHFEKEHDVGRNATLKGKINSVNGITSVEEEMDFYSPSFIIGIEPSEEKRVVSEISKIFKDHTKDIA